MRKNLNDIYSGLWHDSESRQPLCKTYFNDVQNNILVKAVQDALGYAVVIPGSVDE